MWRLGLNRLRTASASVDVPDVAERTNRWHQVRFDGRAEMFVRSALAGAHPPILELRELFLSRIAEKIDRAIDAVEPFPGDLLVRLLILPSHQVHAFWLYFEGSDSSQVLVLDAPGQLEFAEGQVHDPREFMQELFREPHFIGVQE